ncbi:penicillin-binding protein 2, partial [candidate division WWE3 bacterium]|nr:penicillin-binding protein 2 [candidate division WWE3 bacterium]
DLDGESAGFFPSPQWKLKEKGEQWYLGDTYITAIGQGDILVTPLQVNVFTSYFASRGKVYRPKAVKNVEGEAQIKPEPVINDSSAAEHIDAVREGLKLALESGGTAWPFFDFGEKHKGIVLAGKTGTAEYPDPVDKERTHAWFTVFGPYDNPNIVLTVVLEGGGSGSNDAAPVARKILDQWFED